MFFIVQSSPRRIVEIPKKAWKRLWELSDHAGKSGMGAFKREDGYAGKRSERLEKIVSDKERK